MTHGLVCYAYPEAYEAADLQALERLSAQNLRLVPSAALTASAIRLDYQALQVAGLCGELTATLDLLRRFVAFAREAGDVLTSVELAEEARICTSDRRTLRCLQDALTCQQQRLQDERRRRS